MPIHSSISFFFFFNDTATTEIYTLSLHDALPISLELEMRDLKNGATVWTHYYTHDEPTGGKDVLSVVARSEEHTSELQSQSNLVCRLLLEKKKKNDEQRYRISPRARDHSHCCHTR